MAGQGAADLAPEEAGPLVSPFAGSMSRFIAACTLDDRFLAFQA